MGCVSGFLGTKLIIYPFLTGLMLGTVPGEILITLKSPSLKQGSSNFTVHMEYLGGGVLLKMQILMP